MLVYPAYASSQKINQESSCYSLVSRVSLQYENGFLVIPVVINGYNTYMILDTGAEGSLLSPMASFLFKTPRETSRWTVMRGTGGIGHIAPNVRVTSLRIGFAQFGHLSMPVSTLPVALTPRVSGLIGGDLLSHYDVELDVSQHIMSLWRFTRSQCKEVQVAPVGWHYIYRAVPLMMTQHRAFINVILDGYPLLALLDTGARACIVSEKATLRIGVSAQALATDKGGVAQGVDDHKRSYHWHQFRFFQIGQEIDLHPTLTVAPLQDTADMLLGTEWFARHKVWISYQTKTLYIMPIAR